MTIVTIEGEAVRASGWFHRLRVGEVIMVALAGHRAAPRAFRRVEHAGRPMMIEHGTQELALRRALDVPA